MTFPVMAVMWESIIMGVHVHVLGLDDGGFDVITEATGAAALGDIPKVSLPASVAPDAVWAHVESLLERVGDFPWADDTEIEVWTYEDYLLAESDAVADSLRGFQLPPSGGPIQ